MMMKIIVIATLFILAACNANEHSHQENAVKAADEISHKHNDETPGFSLNGDVKWKADVPTRENVKSLQAIADQFSSNQHFAVQEYQKNSEELQAGINKMIKECRMKGADHEALHKWLEPLLEAVKAYKAAGTTTEAQEWFTKIHSQLKLYNQYFE